MSERRRIFSSTRLNEQERAFGKENICDLRQSNKLAGTNSQKAPSSKKSHPSDIGGPCYCNVNPCNNIIYNNVKSSAKKTPFRIHFDRAGNDFNKGVRVRERIVEYDTRRIEELKRNTRFLDNKLVLCPRRDFYTKKEQPEVNVAQNFKKNKEIVPNSPVSSSSDKRTVRSVKSIFDLKLPKGQISITKSLVDLSQESKQSTNIVNKVRDASKQDFRPTKSTKELLCTTSHLRSRYCSDQRTVVVTRSRIASTGSTNKDIVDRQKQQGGGLNKWNAFDGNKDSLFAGISTILSSDSFKNQAITRGPNKSDSFDILISRGKLTNDRERQPLVWNKIPSKVQGKVKNDWEVVKQNTDFSPYLLYHADYLVDLLTIEKDKEDNSPKLSSGFIDKYTNNEPRNIIVAFLIHLATHCRYPSFILYQAVKLFDIILDKIPIDITDMQLVAITALWVVLKKEGNFNNVPSATLMLGLIPNQQYANVDILAEWERVILRSLKFNISFSDPFSIFVFYVVNCDYHDQDSICNRTITKIYYCGGYIIDLTLLDVNFSYITSNHLALATAELVMCIVLDSDADLSNPRWHFWRRIITDGIKIPIRIYDDEINVLRSTMISHVLESEKKHTKEETVKKRYGHNRYGNISNFLLEKIKKIPPENYSISM
ncbi:uncharacterized protein LOC118449806 isoform X2 [Vespa mandarinia]|uniref:uncharacterized protein LOC118449806 isoform X2 n=1 Tax=Vespa mandarinia TaxID=7446 RepID=UPI00161D8737|nr:uncharacterized protein LOC118449806 isoform X2 [Vespa mandarinia]